MSWIELIEDLKKFEINDLMSKLSQYTVYPHSLYKKDGFLSYLWLKLMEKRN